MKVRKIAEAYNVLASAKINKCEDVEKVAAWKVCHAIKKVAEDYQEACRDATSKLNDIEDYESKMQKALEYENKKGENCEMKAEEYKAFVAEYDRVRKLVDSAVKELGDADVTLDVEGISEDAFGRLLASNPDWEMKQIEVISDVIIKV